MIRTPTKKKQKKNIQYLQKSSTLLHIGDQFITKLGELFNLLFLCKKNKGKLRKHVYLASKTSVYTHIIYFTSSLTFWSRLFSSDCTFSCSRFNWAWSADTSDLFLDRTSAISAFALQMNNTCQSDTIPLAIYTINTEESGFLLGNFLLSVGFQGLVTLLLLFDPHQIVLSTSFQSLFILGERAQKTIYQSSCHGFC